MFRISNWDEWIEKHIGLRRITKNKKVEVVNLEQMNPEEVKKHIFGAIKVEDKEEHVPEPLVRFTSEELYTPIFNYEDEHRLEKLRRDIAEAAKIPFSMLYGEGGEND